MDFEEGLQNNLVFCANFSGTYEQSFWNEIILKKNFPVGAGLGGGVRMGPATLHVLINFTKTLSQKKTPRFSFKPWCRCSFFHDPEPSEVRGIGDVIRPLKHYPLLPFYTQTFFSISILGAFQESFLGG
ncbi:MAG: hypothetical protein Ct9H90mP8_2280 [Pseudomonadota bacterium]|nr:MAG: hypothetical protein Ct9H90mP8_2280 [Pseudomonadota bacterium]